MPAPVTSRIPVALDVSCAAERPLTGIGYAAIYQLRSVFALAADTFAFSLFAAGGRGGKMTLQRELGSNHPTAYLPFARLAKYYAWTQLGWPPIEWFTGPARITHNFSHQTPAVSKSVRVVTVHDLSAFRHAETHTARMVQVQQTLLRHTAKHADIIVAVSQSCKNELMDVLGVREDQIRVIPNGVSIDEFDVPLDERRLDELRRQAGIHGPYLIHLGTIEPRKNLVRLLEAYKHVMQTRPDVPQLVLVGAVGWNAAPISEAIAALPGHVVRPGYLSRSDVVLMLRGATACVYPSLYEGFGLPVLEAMAARTPVITSNSTSLPEVAGDTAIYVEPNDTESIVHAIEQVLDDPSAAAQRAQAGRQRAESFTWTASAAKLVSLYQSLAN